MTTDRHNQAILRRFSPAVLAFVVALLALTHLAGFAHFALIQHAQCPEHGDWMHVHGGAPHDAASLEANWHGQDTADGHDHCSAPTALRDRVSPRQPTLLPVAHAATPLPTSPQLGPIALAAPRLTWRTAPKTSPPARA